MGICSRVYVCSCSLYSLRVQLSTDICRSCSRTKGACISQLNSFTLNETTKQTKISSAFPPQLPDAFPKQGPSFSLVSCCANTQEIASPHVIPGLFALLLSIAFVEPPKCSLFIPFNTLPLLKTVRKIAHGGFVPLSRSLAVQFHCSRKILHDPSALGIAYR